MQLLIGKASMQQLLAFSFLCEHYGRFVFDAVVVSSNAIFNFMKEWASNPYTAPTFSILYSITLRLAYFAFTYKLVYW